MKFYSRKVTLFGLILTAVLLGGCQSASQNANNSVQTKETTNAAPIRVSSVGADAAEPAVAADANGNVYVVYIEHGAGKAADLYFQKFDANQNPAGEKKRVNPEAGQATAWFGDAPQIKIGRNNQIFISWTGRIEGAENPNATKLYLSVSGDGGNSFAAPVQVNDDAAPASHGIHSLAVGKNDEVYLAWLDERNIKSEQQAEIYDEDLNLPAPDFQFVKAHHHSNSNQAAKPKQETKIENAEPNSEVFFAASVDGGKTFSANKKLSSEVCPCCKTALAVAPDGRIYVSWRQVLTGDFRHIAVASSIDGGTNFTKPIIVSDDQWQINACPVSGAAMIAGENNSLKVAWFTAGKARAPGLYWAESKDGGASFLPRVLIAEETIVGTSQMYFDDRKNYLLVWAANGKIFTQSIASETKGEAKVFGDGETPASALTGNRLFVLYNKKEADRRSIWLASQSVNKTE